MSTGHDPPGLVPNLFAYPPLTNDDRVNVDPPPPPLLRQNIMNMIIITMTMAIIMTTMITTMILQLLLQRLQHRGPVAVVPIDQGVQTDRELGIREAVAEVATGINSV